MKTLSVTYECWNCTNPAPTHSNGTFQFLAIEPNLDGNAVTGDEIVGTVQAICVVCFEKHADKGMEVAWGKVPIFMQSDQGMIEVSE